MKTPREAALTARTTMTSLDTDIALGRGTLLKCDLRDQFAHLAADVDGGRAAAAGGASPTGEDR
jgi:hypothetical protein